MACIISSSSATFWTYSSHRAFSKQYLENNIFLHPAKMTRAAWLVVDGRVEPVSVEGLKGVEALVGAVGSPRPPPTGGPRQLGDDGGHGDFQWEKDINTGLVFSLTQWTLTVETRSFTGIVRPHPRPSSETSNWSEFTPLWSGLRSF